MTYESLENEIYDEGVEIIQMKFKGNLKALYGNNTIAIDSRIETSSEKACILAEELGHYHKTVGNILDKTKIENVKQEKIARNWGYERLISLLDIIKAFNAGTRNLYEMSEYLNVTETFLNETITHYREKYGLMFEIEEYLIYFEPRLIIIKKF
ncbi:ImmA/IrrE family metallo-endopeptidase [Clostridium sp. 'White wine YQ']|uniref:ImmA/IrrE family metallo-endopeptidase n=1 Tax=Clostridium sp. 'White wine YQ' TaxID=3027474 RepID=UPI0023662D63|nr:ImmA/IrrE family metallo-endopeptidase [Clostridium sp. 'White wine YQ']MDD7794835.1 hypothetical protein [Clostridium sp. 'White wine YQ']